MAKAKADAKAAPAAKAKSDTNHDEFINQKLTINDFDMISVLGRGAFGK